MIVHYDPADLSLLYVRLPDRTFMKVGYADVRRPAIALWECFATLKYLRSTSRMAINETRLFEAINMQRKIIDDVGSKTRTAKKVASRKNAEARSRAAGLVSISDSRGDVGALVDYTTEAPDYTAELWQHDTNLW